VDERAAPDSAALPSGTAALEQSPTTQQETSIDLSGIHPEFPDVPPYARRSIRGHVKVSVRVIVNGEGTVFAALVDDPGPSRYFERLALDAAKKWTFPPADSRSPERRWELVRFDFSRDGTTGRAEPIE
jgi:TonB family protein